MLIDFHTHVFPDPIAKKAIPKLAAICGCPNQTDGTVSDTQEKMKAWGVDAFVLMRIATTPPNTLPSIILRLLSKKGMSFVLAASIPEHRIPLGKYSASIAWACGE